MKLIYIAHPLGAGADREANRVRAARWVDWAARCGAAPVATWITLSGTWGEEQREIGLAIDCALAERCDEVWLVGGRVSEGMRIEAAAAERVGVTVRDLTVLGPEPPPIYPEHPPKTPCRDCDEGHASSPDGRCRDCDIDHMLALGACRECRSSIWRVDVAGPTAAQHEPTCSLRDSESCHVRSIEEYDALRTTKTKPGPINRSEVAP